MIGPILIPVRGAVRLRNVEHRNARIFLWFRFGRARQTSAKGQPPWRFRVTFLPTPIYDNALPGIRSTNSPLERCQYNADWLV